MKFWENSANSDPEKTHYTVFFYVKKFINYLTYAKLLLCPCVIPAGAIVEWRNPFVCF